ncbi:MAG: UDP-N-acetylglucosamine 2-epimerase (non-hydrolyzing) [Acetobacteraceae bacterium]|nr:UDP-N-acetylglucosamine 2-epimerase (non-hydrolyzing) [Acetobacteraceae bacterium]
MSVFGTRPEAVKMAPVVSALRQAGPDISSLVVVTAQHREMLDQVLRHFAIRSDYDLDIMRPRQTLTQITVRALRGLEAVLERQRPHLVLVHGDTSTTFAASLAAFFHRVPVGHVEAGLRTGERYAPFPEEMNRRLTAVLAQLNFAPTPRAAANLAREGVDPAVVFVTGNTAIDALYQTYSPAYRFVTPGLEGLGAGGRRLVLAEAHRRENWGRRMEDICRALRRLVDAFPEVDLLFSVHRNPQVDSVVRRELGGHPRVSLLAPLPYPEWANLVGRAHFVVSDSGGVQEEAPSLGVPVLLLRDVTERPEAIEAGTVRIVGTDASRVFEACAGLLRDPDQHRAMATAVNPYGDGRAAERIVAAIRYAFGLGPRPPDFAPPPPGAARPTKTEGFRGRGQN